MRCVRMHRLLAAPLFLALSAPALAQPRVRLDVSVAPGLALTPGHLTAADSPDLAPGVADPQTDANVANDGYVAPGTHGCPEDLDGYCVRLNDGHVSPTFAFHVGGTVFFDNGIGVGLGLRIAPMAAGGLVDHLVASARVAWRNPRATSRLGYEPFLELGAGYIEVRPRQDAAQDGTPTARPYGVYGLAIATLGVRLDYALSSRIDVFASPLVHIGLPDFGIAFEARLGAGFLFERAPTPVAPAAPADPDGDGLVAPADRCPEIAEDADDHLDDDGCPDPDDDGDGVADADDLCRLIPEDRDGFEDANGCPDADDDSDGLPDVADRCPHDVGPASHEGCPVDDRDGDGVPDRYDNCPDEAGSREFRGCVLEQRVAIEEERITIDEHIQFERDSGVIEARSHGILNDLAAVILAHPEIAHVRVEGHTDSTGTAEHNRHLSTARAESVARYLESRGIEPHRLSAFGYGTDRPLEANASTEEQHARNRRVEFVVLRR